MAVSLDYASPEELEKVLSGLPENVRSDYRKAALTPKSGDDKFFADILNWSRSPEAAAFQQQQLQNLLGFQKEQMKEAGKYKLLFDLPERLVQAATAPSQLMSEGARGIAASMMQAGQQIPNLVGYQRGNFSYTPTRYFG
jgi:hypothetical protein